MNKLHAALFFSLFFTFFISGMEVKVLPEKLVEILPEELKEFLFSYPFETIHNRVSTPEEARHYLVSFSLVNKELNKLANDPLIIKNVVSNLSATLRSQQVYCFYEETIAKKLNTPATKQYVAVNNQLFSEHLTKTDIALLLTQGADPNYRRILHRSYRKEYQEYDEDNKKYDKSRHYYSWTPLMFYASGPSDNDIEIAQYLLECGANINKKASTNDFSTDYPLGIAIECNLPKMIALLVSYNPIFSENEGSDRNYLTKALRKGNPEIISLLMKVPNADLKTALTLAVGQKNIPLIKELFARGATPEMLLKDVVACTLKYPFISGGNIDAGILPTFTTTEILELFCTEYIQNHQTVEEALVYAEIARQRVKAVIKILKTAKQ